MKQKHHPRKEMFLSSINCRPHVQINELIENLHEKDEHCESRIRNEINCEIWTQNFYILEKLSKLYLGWSSSS